MRRIVQLGLGTAVALAVLAVPASASFDHHFSVVSKEASFHETQNGFRFTDELVAVFNHHDRVGRDRGQCREAGKRSLQCRAIIHLNGEVGGFGEIKLNGNIGRHDNRVNVVGGSGDFNGVAGKMLLRGLSGDKDELHFDLVR